MLDSKGSIHIFGSYHIFLCQMTDVSGNIPLKPEPEYIIVTTNTITIKEAKKILNKYFPYFRLYVREVKELPFLNPNTKTTVIKEF